MRALIVDYTQPSESEFTFNELSLNLASCIECVLDRPPLSQNHSEPQPRTLCGRCGSRHVHASPVPPAKPSRSHSQRDMLKRHLPSSQTGSIRAFIVVVSECRAAPHSPPHDTRYIASYVECHLTNHATRESGLCGILHTFSHSCP